MKIVWRQIGLVLFILSWFLFCKNDAETAVKKKKNQTGNTAQSTTVYFTNGESVYTVANNGSLFVAGGSVNGENLILTSPDGVTWTRRPAPAVDPNLANSIKDIVYANNLFVAVGTQGGVLTSPDGITWTNQTPVALAIAETYDKVVYNGAQYFAMSCSKKKGIVSADGVTWVANHPAQLFVSCDLDWDGTQYILVNVFSNQIYTSLDGITWTAGYQFADPNALSSDAIAFDGTNYYAIVWYFVASDNQWGSFFQSSDLISWTPSFNVMGGGFSALTAEAGRIVAGGSFPNGEDIYITSGLANWETRTTNKNSIYTFVDITDNGATTVAVGIDYLVVTP